MKCKDCVYYWQSDDDDFPQCHFDGNLWVQTKTPCECDDWEDEDEYYNLQEEDEDEYYNLQEEDE